MVSAFNVLASFFLVHCIYSTKTEGEKERERAIKNKSCFKKQFSFYKFIDIVNCTVFLNELWKCNYKRYKLTLSLFTVCNNYIIYCATSKRTFQNLFCIICVKFLPQVLQDTKLYSTASSIIQIPFSAQTWSFSHAKPCKIQHPPPSASSHHNFCNIKLFCQPHKFQPQNNYIYKKTTLF